MKYVNEYYNNKYTIINKTNKKYNIVCNHMCIVHIQYGGVVAPSQSKAWRAPFDRCLIVYALKLYVKIPFLIRKNLFAYFIS